MGLDGERFILRGMIGVVFPREISISNVSSLHLSRVEISLRHCLADSAHDSNDFFAFCAQHKQFQRITCECFYGSEVLSSGSTVQTECDPRGGESNVKSEESEWRKNDYKCTCDAKFGSKFE